MHLIWYFLCLVIPQSKHSSWVIERLQQLFEWAPILLDNRYFFRLKLFDLVPVRHQLTALTVGLIFWLLYWLCSGSELILLLLLRRIYCLLFFKVGMLHKTRGLAHDYGPAILWAILSWKQLDLELSGLLEPTHLLLGFIYRFDRTA